MLPTSLSDMPTSGSSNIVDYFEQNGYSVTQDESTISLQRDDQSINFGQGYIEFSDSDSYARVDLASGTIFKQGTSSDGGQSVYTANTYQLDGTPINSTVITQDANGNRAVQLNGSDPVAVPKGAFLTINDDASVDISSPADNDSKVNTHVGPDGIQTTLTDKNDNTVPSSATPLDQANALKTLANAVSTVGDALNFYEAIESGQPVPIVASGLSLANTLENGRYPQLTFASDVAGSALSLLGLENALKNHDTAAAITYAAQATAQGVSAYSAYLDTSASSADWAGQLDSMDASATADEFNTALSYIDIANGLAHHDDTSVAAGVIDILAMHYGLYKVPVLGEMLAAYDIVNALSSQDPPPQPFGQGHFISNPDGTLSISVYGANGGDQTVKDVLSNIQAALDQQIADAEAKTPGILNLTENTIAANEYRFSRAA